MKNSDFPKVSDLNMSVNHFVYLNEIENAIDSLETATFNIDRKDNLKWKWIAIMLHHSIYSFCISCLVQGNYDNVLINYKNGKGHLIPFGTAFEKVQKSKCMECYDGAAKIKVSANQKKSIQFLSNHLRNNFIHFIPKSLCYSISKIKNCCNDAIDIIEILAIKSNNVRYDTLDDKNRVQKAISILKNGFNN